MAILDRIFKRREDKEKKVEQVVGAPKMVSVQETLANNKPELKPEISMFELENADWKEFASILKANRLLPNSYLKKPVDVKVAVDMKNKPMVLLTFVSETSDSVREILLRQDMVSQSINGVVNGKDDLRILDVWLDYQRELRDRHESILCRDARRNKIQGKALKSKAEKMIALENLLLDELAFLEEYQNVEFDLFMPRIVGAPPQFTIWSNEQNRAIDFVTPFSPKTLEFCLLRLSEESKADEGIDLETFVQKCRDIQTSSCYESEDWDKVIGYGKKMMLDAWERAESQESEESRHGSGIVKF